MDRDGWPGLLDETVVLNVTVRCGLGGFAGSAVLPPDMDDRRGVASLELDAMMQAGFYAARGCPISDDGLLPMRALLNDSRL
jgi:hypothetical protein